jgi:hypothetical protein
LKLRAKDPDELLGGWTCRGWTTGHSSIDPGVYRPFLSAGLNRFRSQRVDDGANPEVHGAHARTHARAAVIGATYEMILVRNVEVPEHAVQELSTVMGIQEIVIARIDINCQAGLTNQIPVRKSAVGGIV